MTGNIRRIVRKIHRFYSRSVLKKCDQGDVEEYLIGIMTTEELESQIKPVIFQHSERSPKEISDAEIAQQLGQKNEAVAKITAKLFDAAYIERVDKGWRWKYEPLDSPMVEVKI